MSGLQWVPENSCRDPPTVQYTEDLVLLAGAGAMIRNLIEHCRLDHAFKTTGLVVANLALPIERYNA
jgi:hypothetical protein